MNPQAFPVNDMGMHGTCGMTLRDYFAAKAMNAFISNAPGGTKFGKNHEETNTNFAIASYAMADAMMKARND